MKARSHLAVMQRVGKRHDGHALMMGHIGAHDFELRALRQAGRGVIDRFVPAIRAADAETLQGDIVSRRRGRIDHRGKAAGIGRDHDVVAQAAFQPEVGDTETGILKGLFDVAGEIAGFRHAPWHAQFAAVILLTADDQPVGVFEQAARRCAHDERRHQILEHRAGPRDQAGIAADGRQGAAEMKPVLGGHIALGDGDETGQPRFRGQQIVEIGIERTVGAAIANGEQLPVLIEKEIERHRIE